MRGLPKRVAKEFDIWKTVKLGAEESSHHYIQMLEKSGYYLDDTSSYLLRKIEVSKKIIGVDLVNVSVKELGFKYGAWFEKICARALESGLELCVPEIGPALRLAYDCQPEFENLPLGMKPIKDSFEITRIFAITEMSGLVGYLASPGKFWKAEDRFIFVLPRKDLNLEPTI